MAKIVENIEGKRRLVKLSIDDVISIIREYQAITKGCFTSKEIRAALKDRVFFIPEEI